MYAVIEDSRDRIAQLCRLYGVRRLEIFGSALREDFNPETSDVDVVAEFEKRSQTDGVRQYFDLKDKLEQFLKNSSPMGI